MKITPLLLKTPMVQATIENRKTITRRIIKPQIRNGVTLQWHPDGYYLLRSDITGLFDTNHLQSPYGKPGDILWVRESAKYVGIKATTGFHFEGQPPVGYKSIQEVTIEYLADNTRITLPYPSRLSTNINLNNGLSNGIFKEAARLFLRITDIKVERLQDISEKDCILEGSIPKGASIIASKDGAFPYFISLWKSINGPASWNLNPWVWVISFEKCEKPENF